MSEGHIILRDVRKSFGPKHVLNGINLSVAKGQSLVVIGGSGTGKSVMLKCILGILRADAGQILIGGEDVTHVTGKARHELLLRGQCIAVVEMLSVFVRRAQTGNNRSIVRAVMAGADAATPSALAAAAEAFVQRGRALRCAGPRSPADAPSHASAFTPCPYNDFNGADLLYFSSFQSMVDRAEWDWMHNAHPAHLRERELVFYGNLDIGDSIRSDLRAAPACAGQFAHCSVLQRGSDGLRMAEIFTRKQLARPAQALAA